MSWSPEAFEASYRRTEQRLYGFLTRHGSLATGIVYALVVLALCHYTKALLAEEFPNGSRIGGVSVMRLFRFGMPIAVLFSFAFVRVPPRFLSRLNLGGAALLWLFSCHFLLKHVHDPALRIFAYLILPATLAATWVFLKWCQNGKRIWPAAILYSCFFWGLAGAFTYFLYEQNSSFLGTFWRLKTQFIWMSALVFAFRGWLTDEKIQLLVSPVNALRGVLWPGDGRRAEDSERSFLWWWGMSNIILGYALFSSRLWFVEGIEVDSHILRVIKLYLLAHLGDVAMFNVVSGSIRIFGYRIRHATNFAFLATTPAEYWRRISVYDYIFVLQNVYVPLFRVMRSRLLVTFGAFTVFYINHFGLWNLLNFFYGLAAGHPFLAKSQRFGIDSMSESAANGFFFLTWFLLIYVTQKYWFFSWKKIEDTWWAGWASILANHAVSIFAVYSSQMAAHYVFGGNG